MAETDHSASFFNEQTSRVNHNSLINLRSPFSAKIIFYLVFLKTKPEKTDRKKGFLSTFGGTL